MTKSYFLNDSTEIDFYNTWKGSIIAPKFTLKNFVDELHYYLRIYIRRKKSLVKILIFIFLNVIQRILYTFGTNLVKIKHK